MCVFRRRAAALINTVRGAAWSRLGLCMTVWVDATYTDILVSPICERTAQFSQVTFPRYSFNLTLKLYVVWGVIMRTCSVFLLTNIPTSTMWDAHYSPALMSIPLSKQAMKTLCINKFPVIPNHVKADKSISYTMKILIKAACQLLKLMVQICSALTKFQQVIT